MTVLRSTSTAMTRLMASSGSQSVPFRSSSNLHSRTFGEQLYFARGFLDRSRVIRRQLPRWQLPHQHIATCGSNLVDMKSSRHCTPCSTVLLT